MRLPGIGQSSLALLVALLMSSLQVQVQAQAQAQAKDGTLLVGKNVTEKRVVEALLPEAGSNSGVPTRGIAASMRDSPAMATLKPRKKASASLLITFETNSSELTSQSKQQLDTVAAALKDDRLSAFTFEVEGHADPRGSSSANLALSQRRAESAREYLVGQHGIAPDRLRAIGKGDLEPWNKRDLTAPVNRRVAFTTVGP